MKPPSNNRQVLALQAIQEASSEPVYRRGVQYYRRKKVLKYEENETGSSAQALVIGSEPQPYKVVLVVAGELEFTAECSCPYFEPICKHSVAVVLTHIARSHPGIRFDLQDSDKKNGQSEKAPKAKDFLDDPKEEGVEAESKDFMLGVLVLEKPLALIVGVLPEEVRGKVNILKVPPQILDTLENDSKIWKLTRYLTSLPQTTKGQAGGHRIPRGDEGVVIGHLGLCAKLVNTSNGEEMTYSKTA
ncbi:MAG: SWIM zinc finger family protein, partial [Candidatus Obscuribacterales bacterium]|nr:SWIM zinc finger family protein [Candidatus Obscuribacterales bacterium]